MLEIELSSQPVKFLKKARKDLARRLMARIKRLAMEPFPPDVKRVVNRKEKVFRIRLGGYRIQYYVVYRENILYITKIEKRPKSY